MDSLGFLVSYDWAALQPKKLQVALKKLVALNEFALTLSR